MALLETLIQSVFNAVGAATAAGTTVVAIVNPPAGRYTVWAMGRHSVDDGLRLTVGGNTKAVLAGAAGSVKLDKMNVDVDGNQNIAITLNTATGIGTASATLFAQRLCDHMSDHTC